MFSRVLCRGGLLKPETQRERLMGQRLVGTKGNNGEGVAYGDGFCGHSGTLTSRSELRTDFRFDFLVSINDW